MVWLWIVLQCFYVAVVLIDLFDDYIELPYVNTSLIWEDYIDEDEDGLIDDLLPIVQIDDTSRNDT